jgi:hypothetical protein
VFVDHHQEYSATCCLESISFVHFGVLGDLIKIRQASKDYLVQRFFLLAPNHNGRLF